MQLHLQKQQWLTKEETLPVKQIQIWILPLVSQITENTFPSLRDDIFQIQMYCEE